MDGNKRKFFKKPQNIQFKRKGVSKKGKWNTSSGEQSSEDSLSADTVYRILCPSRKIGSVIGKGGGIVKALREDTQAKITVADLVPGSDERVIVIFSSGEKFPKKQNHDGDTVVENEQDPLKPHCAAQDALLRVHDRIVEEDLFGGIASDDDNENNVVTARLLVPNNMVGCVLGKGGDVIQRLRSETGANIRVLPADRLPSCAMSTDELVQISGKSDVAKRALFEVSTLLHMNPRKENPLNFPTPYGGQSFHPPGGPIRNMLSPANPMWPRGSTDSHRMPPIPWAGGYDNQPSGFGPGIINGTPRGHGEEPLAEFSMKILCSAGKIGGLIGKGGSNVKLVQQETGASIHVEDASAESDERAIRVSAMEALWNPRSQTIDAILQIQNKISDTSEKGAITTRLLVPSSKVGCILGQGGQVINEMRRRTQADIRVFSKEDKPNCASEDEELVQISGNFGIAKDALAEIASRLRLRTLRDTNVGAEPRRPIEPVQDFVPLRSFSGRGLRPSGSMESSSSGGYESLRGGGRDYEHQSYSVLSPAIGYSKVNMSLEGNISRNGLHSLMAARGSDISNIGEVAGARVNLHNPESGSTDFGVEIRGSSDHLTATQSFRQSYITSAGHNMNSQVSYQNMSSQQSSYQNMNPQQSPYQTMNQQQSPYSLANHQQGVYSNLNAPHGVYHISARQGTGTYHISSQQGTYQY